jgi:putative hydrolase of the HAD superfamily
VTSALGRFPFADEVRAVLFDAGNTLLCIDPRQLAGALASVGIATEVDAVGRAEVRIRPVFDERLAATSPETDGMFRLFADLLLEELRVEAPADLVQRAADALVAIWPGMWTRVPGDAAATLDDLARRGFRLGVVSNSDGTVRDQLRRAGLVGRFEFVVDSREVGIAKPDPRIFALAASHLGLPASHCAYVGDLHSIDVVGARAAGMHAVLVDPAGHWTRSDAAKIRRLSDLPARLA